MNHQMKRKKKKWPQAKISAHTEAYCETPKSCPFAQKHETAETALV